MVELIVDGTKLRLGDLGFTCGIGRNGITEDKHEGDGCTPMGTFLLRECWYRPDRLSRPETGLPVKHIRPEDGWCDDPAHPDYNRHVVLPFQASHERLWRDDGAYDLMVPLGYNDEPPVAGKGSAIFLHVLHPGRGHTEGCIALKQRDLLEVLKHCNTATRIVIRP